MKISTPTTAKEDLPLAEVGAEAEAPTTASDTRSRMKKIATILLHQSIVDPLTPVTLQTQSIPAGEIALKKENGENSE
jgi:hypothetical protein